MGRAEFSRFGAIFVLAALWMQAGCASTRPPRHLDAGDVTFQYVGKIDMRCDSEDDYRQMVQPGDLIVNHMRLGRAARKREWLFAILPYGHSMIVLDPEDEERGILECRFQGTERVGVKELDLYSFNLVYRIADHERLNMARLEEFSEHGCENCRRYSFRSWLAIQGNLWPDKPEEIDSSYTCSTMVVAAYHYAGLDLDVGRRRRVITPMSVVASPGKWNRFALPSSDRLRSQGERELVIPAIEDNRGY